MTDANGSDTTTIAWEHVYTTSPPELRRWLDNSKPVAMHQDALMVAVPNNFTRNQLEGRFRPDIEQQLSDYFQRSVQLAVIVDATVSPEPAGADQATANGRFDEPMTKVSNVYFGFSRASISLRGRTISSGSAVGRGARPGPV